MERLAKERVEVLGRFGVDSRGEPDVRVSERRGYGSRVSPRRETLSPLDRAKLHWQLFKTWDGELDHGAGECVLARPELSKIVADALLHFDGDRYFLTDVVVMPNHVHVLVAFRDEEALLAQCEAWKRYTARQIQKALGRQGEFWQVEQFDHLVRSEEQFEYFRRYIAENPKKAALVESACRVYSKRLG
jgi:putative transposase